MTKKKLGLVRGVRFWISYDPVSSEICGTYKYKYQVPVVPGRHEIEVKGYYVPERKRK